MHGNYWTDAIGCEIVNGPVATIQELLRHLTNPDKKRKKGEKKTVNPLAVLEENIKVIPLRMNVFVQQFRGPIYRPSQSDFVLDRVDGQTPAATRRCSDCSRLTLPDRPLSRRGKKRNICTATRRGLAGGVEDLSHPFIPQSAEGRRSLLCHQVAAQPCYYAAVTAVSWRRSD